MTVRNVNSLLVNGTQHVLCT